MNWLLKANLMVPTRAAAKTFSLDFFKSEGGLRGFVSDQKLENNMVIFDLFDDAKKYKNLVVGRKKENYSMDLVNLTLLKDGLDSVRLDVECHSTNSKVIKYYYLDMLDVRMSSLGLTSVGQNTLYCYKFTFYQANDYIR